MIISNNEQKPNFSENEGVWEYRTFDDELLGYSVRKKKPGGKRFVPWSFQDGKWIAKWYESDVKPIYNAQLLKKCPNKSVLIVEGEKAADAATILLPDFVCVTWMGGSGSAGKIDTTHFEGKKVCIWPDNDQPGFNAAEKIKKKLKGIASYVGVVNPKPLGVREKWDLADFDNEQCEIDLDTILIAIDDASNQLEKLDSCSFPDLSEKDRPLNTTDNIAHLLSHYKLAIKYNLMTNSPEFDGCEKKFSSENEADCFFTEISNLCVKNGVPKIDLFNHINLIAERNRYHPAISFIESKPWDGVSRINDLLETITSTKQDLANKLIFRWLVSCVAALYLPQGIASEGALVLQGAQKIGKTYWLLKLVPMLHRHLVKEGVSISVNNKDDIIKATNVWIAELGEIESTFKKSDVNELKNFITSSYDEYRAPFGRFSKKFWRRTIFYGSVNSQHFLADETGNRRFWTVPVTHIDYEHTIDMQQLWSEIKTLYDSGESYRLTPDEQELLNESNRDYECINPLKEALQSDYYWGAPARRWMTATQIIQEMDITPDKSKTNNMANILRELNIESRKSKHGIQYSIPYMMPEKLKYQ
jgi:hypothetical protein